MGTSDPLAETARTLCWSRTIDRALVHRDSVAEVLLTDLIKLSDTQFRVAAQWPRSHRVYRPDRNGRHDPMLILESIRQTGLALSHFGFGTDFEQRSVMLDVGFTLDPRNEPRALLSATNLDIAVTCRDLVRRGKGLRGMTVELSFAADGLAFATGTGTIRWVSASSYVGLRARTGAVQLDWDQLRWTTTTPPTGHSPIRAAADALLVSEARPGRRRRLVVPLDHPVYFDHPLDHAPGMLLVDAAWQALVEHRGDEARLVSCTMVCPAFTELGVDTDILLTPVSSDATDFKVQQQGRETASGTLRVAV